MININTRTEHAIRNKVFAGKPPYAQLPQKVAAHSDRLSSSGRNFLESALIANPEVRPEVVERARKLATDPNYPPAEVIDELSRLIVEAEDLSELT